MPSEVKIGRLTIYYHQDEIIFDSSSMDILRYIGEFSFYTRIDYHSRKYIVMVTKITDTEQTIVFNSSPSHFVSWLLGVRYGASP